MVKKEKLIIILVAAVILTAYLKPASAQDDYPGFGLQVSGIRYTEISKNNNDIEISQQIVQIIYRDPQAFRVSFGLGWEEIDDEDYYQSKYPAKGIKEIDDAPCFRATAAYYLAPNLELGIPADFSIEVDYSRARHDLDDGNGKLTHQRIIGTANLEWDFHPATPYVRVGALYSSLAASGNGIEDEDNTSALFIGGIRFSLAQRLTLGAEFNISKDIGFGGTVGYYF